MGNCKTPWWYGLKAHAHLLGTDCVNRDDLIPSAVLCVLFFLIGGGLAFKWFYKGVARYMFLLVMGAAIIITGLGFAVRAAISTTSAGKTSLTTILAEQVLFLLGELLLIDSHVSLSRELVKKWAGMSPSTWVYINHLILVVSFILSVISYSKLPDPNTAAPIPLISTQLRIAGSFLPLFLTLVNAVWLPFEKVDQVPGQPSYGMGLLVFTIVAWFLVVPAFYSFVVSAVTADTSPLVTSRLFFYLAFGLFQALAILPFLAVPIGWFLKAAFAGGYVPGNVQARIDIEADLDADKRLLDADRKEHEAEFQHIKDELR